MTSRRAFLRLVAVGSAAAMTRGATGAAAAAAKKATAATKPATTGAPMSAATRTEIDKQIKSTKDTLKTIRAYELPAGSPVAFVFSPLKPKREGGH
jgi:hypothetical protein